MGRLSSSGMVLLLVAIGGGGVGLALGAEPEPAIPAGAGARATTQDVDVPLSDLVQLAPGTQVDRTLPQGWNHLVVKSIPRLASGDLDSLPGMASATATRFRTVILADVRPIGEGARRRYVLRRIGLGLCTPVRGRDTVVTTNTLQAQGVELGMVARTVLDRAEQELHRGRLIARTPTFALFSAPCVIRAGTTHRDVLIRYALLVDPATGSLQTLVWTVAPDPASRVAAPAMVLIKPGVIFDCALDVAAERLFGAVPVSWSFAMKALPPGQVRALPADVQPWSVRDVKTPLETSRFEDALRLALVEPPSATTR
jgi:hypothetical protein